MTSLQLRSLTAFIDANDRLPTGRDGVDALQLQSWLDGLREQLAAQRIARAQIDEYDRVAPGWSLPYVNSLDASRAVTFHRRALLTASHFDAFGCFPTKTDTDADIARLGEWLRQMRGASRGRNRSSINPERIALFDRLLPGWDTSKSEVWIARARDIEAFVDAQGRFPAASSSRPEEERMWLWLFHNKKAIHGDRRGGAAWQAEYLDRRLPGWNQRQTAKFDTYWQARLNAAVSYRSEHGRFPDGHVEGTEEALLTQWLAQNRRDRTGAGDKKRETLDNLLPGWRDVRETRVFALTRDGRWRDNLAAFRAFTAAHGRFPSAGAQASTPGRFLRAWIVRQRLTATPERSEKLDAAAPGWRDAMPRARPNVPVRGGLEDTSWMVPRLGDILTTSTQRRALVVGVSLLPTEDVRVQFSECAGTLRAGGYSITTMRTSRTVHLAGAFVGASGGVGVADMRARVRELLAT